MNELKAYLKQYNLSFGQTVTRIDDRFFIIPESLKKYEKNRPAYLGDMIGMIRRERFIPSIVLLQWMQKHNAPSVTISPEQEWRFICGNNIQRKDITTIRQGRVIVLNIHNECIGTATVEDKYLKRTYDIGDLLRRERKKKS